MLAKEIKISIMKKQKDFIAEAILKVAKACSDGCAVYKYCGFIYPEVQKALEEEGIKFTPISPDHNGVVRTLISVEDVELTEEELKQAAEYDYSQDIIEDDEEDDNQLVEVPVDFISALLQGGLCDQSNDDEDDPYKYEDCDEYDPLEDDSQA